MKTTPKPNNVIFTNPKHNNNNIILSEKQNTNINTTVTVVSTAVITPKN
jgi:hypothetical protein